MSNELIRKSEVLNAIENAVLTVADDAWNDAFNGYTKYISRKVMNMPPVKAVELPCEVKATVYVLYKDTDDDEIMIYESNVDGFVVRRDGSVSTVVHNSDYFYNQGAWGTELFLTREEAEKALEEMKKC